MSRREAVAAYEVPGMPGRVVRVSSPGVRPDGRLKGSYRITFYDHDGRRGEITAVGLEAAKQRALNKVAELGVVASVGPKAAHPVRSLVDCYLTEFADEREWSLSYRRERSWTAGWLPNWFESILVYNWNADVSRRILKEVREKGYPRGSQEYRRVGAFLSGLRSCAWEYGFLPRSEDPMSGIKYNPTTRRQRRSTEERHEALPTVRRVSHEEVPTHEAWYAMAEAAARRSGRWYEAIRVALFSGAGMRWGEVADLRVGDLNLDGCTPTVHITRQTVEVDKEFSVTGETLLVDQPPKGGITRHAFVDPALLPLLRQRRDELQREAGPNADISDGRLLPTATGRPWRESNYLTKVWRPCAQELGWQRLENMGDRPTGSRKSGLLWTPHSGRHLYATWLIRDCQVGVALVSEYMGHGDSKVTEKMYVHRGGAAVDLTMEKVLTAPGRATAPPWRDLVR